MDNHVKAIAQALADELQLDLEGDHSVSVPGIVRRIREQLKDDPSFDAEAFNATALAPLERPQLSPPESPADPAAAASPAEQHDITA